MTSTDGLLLSSDTDVEDRLNLLRKILTERGDVTLPIYKALETMIVDWMAALCKFSLNGG